MKSETVKTAIASVFAVLTSAIDRLAMPFTVMCLLMAADYCTGLLISKQTGTVCSRTGLKGILKKLGYVAAVMAAAGVDYTISYVSRTIGEETKFKVVFTLLIIFWLIINECISILENLKAMGVPLPGFLLSIAEKLKKDVESKGDNEDDGHKA